MAPPLIINEEQMNMALERIDHALKNSDFDSGITAA